MRCLVVLAATLLAVPACQLIPEVGHGPPGAEVEAVPPRFDWRPGRLEVEESIEKSGHRISTRYTLEISDADPGLAVEYRDFRFVAFDGLDLDDPQLRPQVDAVERQFALLQLGFRVRDDGAFSGLLDLEQIERGFGEFYGPDAASELRAKLADPRWNQILTETVAGPWRSWVEVWIGLEARSGEVLEDEIDVEFGGVTQVHHVRYEHRGPDPDRPGHVLLRHVDTCDDPRFLLALGEMAVALAPEEAGVPGPEQLERLAAAGSSVFSYRKEVEASLDPRTLVPARVSATVHARFEAREQVEAHTWTFSAHGGRSLRSIHRRRGSGGPFSVPGARGYALRTPFPPSSRSADSGGNRGED